MDEQERHYQGKHMSINAQPDFLLICSNSLPSPRHLPARFSPRLTRLVTGLRRLRLFFGGNPGFEFFKDGNYKFAQIRGVRVIRGLLAFPQCPFYPAGFFHPNCLSMISATARTSSSLNGRPMTCTPIGRPSGERPTGTTAAGLPRRL